MGLFFIAWRLLPAKCLTQNPERYCYGNEEEAKTNRAAPAKPRSPRTPVFHTSFVVPVVAFLVLNTFALMLHSIPFLLVCMELVAAKVRLSLFGSASLLIHVMAVCPSMSFAEMSSAWVQWDAIFTQI